MERKSIELYVQSAAWTGGIAAAATGGVLLALVNHDTPSSLVSWLRLIGVALLAALAAAAYMQFHAIAMLNAQERERPNDATKSAKHIAQSQFVMLGGLAVAVLILGVGLIRFHMDAPPANHWSVAAIGNAGGDALVIMSRSDSSTVRILVRKAGQDNWQVSELNGDGVAATKNP